MWVVSGRENTHQVVGEHHMEHATIICRCLLNRKHISVLCFYCYRCCCCCECSWSKHVIIYIISLLWPNEKISSASRIKSLDNRVSCVHFVHDKIQLSMISCSLCQKFHWPCDVIGLTRVNSIRFDLIWRCNCGCCCFFIIALTLMIYFIWGEWSCCLFKLNRIDVMMASIIPVDREIYTNIKRALFDEIV